MFFLLCRTFVSVTAFGSIWTKMIAGYKVLKIILSYNFPLKYLLWNIQQQQKEWIMKVILFAFLKKENQLSDDL